jgi:hypothetical protein
MLSGKTTVKKIGGTVYIRIPYEILTDSKFKWKNLLNIKPNDNFEVNIKINEKGTLEVE